MAKNDRYAIYWNGEVVGYIENLQVDMFHWYGKWVSNQTEDSQAFLTTLASLEDDAEPLSVSLGDVDAIFTVQFLPDENGIDLVYRRKDTPDK